MEIEDPDAAGNQFSYEILDQEAAKISSIIQVVQRKCLQTNSTDAAQDLFVWADQLAQQGHRAESEFLYLHAIHLAERVCTPAYPQVFSGLREYAASMISAAREMLALELDRVAPIEILQPASIHSNAA